MELRAEDILAPDRGCEHVSVIGAGGDQGRIGGLRVVAVDEIDVAAIGHPAVERAAGANDLEPVPADLRDLQGRGGMEADDAPLENAEARGLAAELVAAFEQRLVADADPQEWASGSDELGDGRQQFLPRQGLDAIVERADTGQDQSPGPAEGLGAPHTPNIRSHVLERFLDAPQVAGSIVDQRDHAGNNRKRPAPIQSEWGENFRVTSRLWRGRILALWAAESTESRSSMRRRSTARLSRAMASRPSKRSVEANML